MELNELYQVAGIVGSIGTVAVFIVMIWTLILERKKFRLSVKPELKENGGGNNPSKGETTVRIECLNNKATITKIKSSKNIVWKESRLPNTIREKDSFSMVFHVPKSENTRWEVYDIEIYYYDSLGNKYQLKLFYKGAFVQEIVDKRNIFGLFYW